MNDYTIVLFGSTDWDSHHQRPQAVAGSLARLGADVIYVDNVGMRLPRLRDVKRVARRLNRAARRRTGVSGGPRGKVRRISPLVFPLHHRRLFRKISSTTLVRQLRPLVSRDKPVIVWTYLPVPVVADVARSLRADLLVYDWADDFSEHVLSPSGRHLRRIAGWELDMTAAADVVFAASQSLVDRKESRNEDTYVVPHGMHPFGRNLKEPDDVAPLPHPRIGFVGSISEWIDLELLDAIAERRPNWSLILVGPTHIRIAHLTKRQNVHYLGRKEHEEVPRYLSSFDAGVIPYRDAPAITAASPLKLREYLAHGLPVVSVDIPEVRRFVPPVQLAKDPDGFVAALEEGLRRGKTTAHTAEVRTWKLVTEEMLKYVDDALVSRRREP